MGAITAVVSKKNEDVAETAVAMLNTLKHKGVETFGLASPTNVKIVNCVSNFQDTDISSPILVGHIFSRILASDTPQPIKLGNGTLVFEGRIYPLDTGLCDAEFIAEELNKNLGDVETLIKDFEGDFAFAVAKSGRFIAGRGRSGAYPLYYGENANLAALASGRKALWRIGIRKVHSFPLGHIAAASKLGFKLKPVRTLVHPKTKKITMQTATRKLQKLLQRSVEQRVSVLKEVAVAFSGGLDSSIIAFLAKSLGVEVHLISVSLENLSEIEHTKKAAEALHLPLHIHVYSEKAVEQVLPKVLWPIEESNHVKVSVGIPVFWTAERASEMGLKVMLAGQGADELFGGYKRYLNDYARYGTEIAQRTIFNDILRMHENNSDRDNKICSFHNIELRLPFAAYQLTEFAGRLPLHLKIESPEDMLRKTVLRKAAEDMGLPHFITNKPKRAIQYGTGVNKIIKKLAKEKGFSTKEYLLRTFDKVFEDLM